MTAITQSHAHPDGAAAPRIWLLFGERRGDNAQVRALADLLGWPAEVKQLHWLPEEIDPAKAGVSLAGLDQAASDPLTAPWPDIIVGIGYRSAPVARWIAAQGGGRALNIRLGRPRTDLSPYDLVITTPQYGLPPATNVRELPLPLVAVDKAEAAKAASRWQAAFEALPKPWVAVLLGGPTQHMAFDDAVARTLAHDLNQFAERAKCSLLITTSPRSPRGLQAIVGETIRRPHFFHQWAADADNPYFALLSLSDAAIVTGDSASMMADAAAFDLPVLIYELPWLGRSKKPGLIAGIKRHVRERRERRGMASLPADPLDRFYDMLTRMGRARPRRNVLGLMQRLYDARIAKAFRADQPDLSWRPAPVARDDRDRLVAEIKALWVKRKAGG